MGEKKLFLTFVLLLIFLQLVSAGSVGINPANFEREYFEPNMERTYKVNLYSSNNTQKIKLFLEGDLAEFASADQENFIGPGSPTITLKLPASLSKAGPNTLFIGAIEDKEDVSGSFESRAAVRVPIIIFVPYPGVYLESEFTILDINIGEESNYSIKLDNLGTESLTINSDIKIYEKENLTKVILTEDVGENFLKSKESKNLHGPVKTANLPPGNYIAVATIKYSNKTDTINRTLRVGHFSVEIEDYEHTFERGKINPFSIIIKSEWNSMMKNVYTKITVTDNGKIVDEIKTPSIDLNPWERATLSGFFDATDLISGRYLANIVVYYEGSSKNKLVAIYVNDPPKEKFKYTKIAIIISAGIIILILIVIYLTYKIIKLKSFLKKYGKKKKRNLSSSKH
ncbi:MAG: hypothetical protein ABIF88_02920 [archaeon]